MRTGGKGIRELREEANKLGLTLSKEAAEDAEEFADSISNLSAAFKGLGIALTSAGLPALIIFIDKLTVAATAINQFRKDTKLIREEQERLAKINEENAGVLGKLAANYNRASDAIRDHFFELNPLFKLTKIFVKSKRDEADAIRETTKARLEETVVTASPLGDKGDGENTFFENFKKGLEAVKNDSKLTFGDITRTVEINTQAWSDAFGDAILDGKAGFKDFRDFAVSAINDIVREMFKAIVIAPFVQGLTSAIGGFFTGGTGLLSGLVGGAATAGGGAIPGTSLGTFSISPPGRADGGDLNKGQTAIVGERGPEVFTPDVAGTIIPNNKLGGGSVVNLTQNFNMSPGLEETVQAKIEEAAPFIAQQAQTAVFQAIEKGGGASRSVGRRA